MRHRAPDAGRLDGQRVGRAGFQPQALDQILRDLQPVGGRGAHVRQRLEVVGQCGLRGLHALDAPGLAAQRDLGLGRTLDDAGHAAERQPDVGHRVAVERNGEATAQRRDVAVEALADLVRTHLPLERGQRDDQALHELARLQPVLHVVDVEVLQRHATHALALAQLDLRVERHQHRRRIADRRAVGDVAAHRARMADRRRRKAQPDIGERRRALRQRAPGGFERSTRADVERTVELGHGLHIGHVADVDDVAQVAKLLVDPEPDVGRAGEQLRLGHLHAQRRQFGERGGRMEMIGARAPRRGVVKRVFMREAGERHHHRGRVEPGAGQIEHALAGIEDGPVTGAAAQVARQVVGQLLAGGLGAGVLVMLVGRPERHHEARRAEAALRAVALDHRLLHRVQALHRTLVVLVSGRLGLGCGSALALQVFDREQRLAVQRRQELDAGIDGLQREPADGARHARCRPFADDHRACTAIALVAPFLGAGAVRVLAQPIEHRAGRMRAGHVDDPALVEEADGLAGARAHGL